MEDFIPVEKASEPDFIPVTKAASEPDFIPAKQEPTTPWYDKPFEIMKGTGQDTINKGVEALKNIREGGPLDAAAGMLHGATVGLAGAVTGAIEGINNAATYGAARLFGNEPPASDEERAKLYHSTPITQAGNNIVNDFIGINEASPEAKKAFEGGGALLAAPFSAFGENVGKQLGPEAQLAAEALMAAQVVHMAKPRAVRPEATPTPEPIKETPINEGHTSSADLLARAEKLTQQDQALRAMEQQVKREVDPETAAWEAEMLSKFDEKSPEDPQQLSLDLSRKLPYLRKLKPEEKPFDAASAMAESAKKTSTRDKNAKWTEEMKKSIPEEGNPSREYKGPEQNDKNLFSLFDNETFSRRSGDVWASLEGMVSHPYEKLLLSIFKDRLPNLEIRVRDFGDLEGKNPRGINAQFVTGENAIRMNHNGGVTIPNLLHEGTHAVIYSWMNLNKDHPVTRASVRLYNFSEPIIRRAANLSKDKDLLYALTNTHEFLSEVVSNKKVRDLLSKVTLPETFLKDIRREVYGNGPMGKFRTALDLAVSLFGRVLGLRNENVTHQVFNLVAKIADEHVKSPIEQKALGQEAVKRGRIEGDDFWKLDESRARANRDPFKQETRDKLTPKDRALDVERIVNAIRTSKSFAEMQRKFENLKGEINQEDYAHAIAHIKDFWNNKESLDNHYSSQESAYSKYYNKQEGVLAMDTRPADQALKELKEAFKGKWEDMKARFTDVLPAEQVRRIRHNTPTLGDAIYNYAQDRVRSIGEDWDKTAHNFLKIKLKDNALYKLAKISGEDRKALFDAWLDLERNPDKVLGGTRWASERQLREEYHLSDEAIAAKMALNDMLDGLFDYVNASRVKAGLKPVHQISEYFPHMLKGPYRIHLGLDGKTIEIKGFQTRKQVEDFIKENFKDRTTRYTGSKDNPLYIIRNVKGKSDYYSPTDVHVQNFGVEMALMAEMQLTKGKLNPLVKQRLDQLETNAQTAFLRHAMERDVNAYGYIGSKGVNTGLMAWWKNQDRVKDVEDVVHRYARGVFEYGRNTDISAEVFHPIVHWFRKNEANLPLHNTRQVVTDWLNNAMGRSPNKLLPFENTLFHDWLQDRFDFRPLIPALNKLIFFKALAGNVGFLAGQVIQPIQSAMFIHQMKVDLQANGYTGKMPNATKVITMALKDVLTPSSLRSKEIRDALQYAKDNHIVDSAIWESLANEIRSSGIGTRAFDMITLRTPAEKIEAFSRGNVFLQGYRFAKEAGFSNEAALGAATRFTDVTMGNYSSTFRPMMNQNYGALGHLYSPFATLANTYLGNTAKMMVDLKQSKANGTKFRAAEAAAYFMMGNVVLAGLTGIIGLDEWDKIARMWNNAVPEHPMPNPTQFLFSKDVPDFLLFGGISEASKSIPGLEHGISIGGMMNMPSVVNRFAAPTFDLVTAGVKSVGMGVSALAQYMGFGTGPSPQDYYDVSNKLAPPPMRALVEKQYQSESGITPTPSNISSGFYKRDESDLLSRLLGYRSVEEQKALYKFHAAQDSLNQSANERKAKLKKLNDMISLDPKNPAIPKLMEDLATNHGMDSATIGESIKNAAENRNLTAEERLTQKGLKGKDPTNIEAILNTYLGK